MDFEKLTDNLERSILRSFLLDGRNFMAIFMGSFKIILNMRLISLYRLLKDLTTFSLLYTCYAFIWVGHVLSTNIYQGIAKASTV